jgi:hypothetical protein
MRTDVPVVYVCIAHLPHLSLVASSSTDAQALMLKQRIERRVRIEQRKAC